MKATVALSLVALVFASGASAQCATSVNTGGGNCVPPDAAGMPAYHPGRAAAPPPAQWQSTWGAIALDTIDGGKGVTTGQGSESAAEQAAMSECSSTGVTHCRIVFTYANQCAAIAWGDHSFGKAAGATIADAESEAASECAKGGPGCKTVYSACSPARKIGS